MPTKPDMDLKTERLRMKARRELWDILTRHKRPFTSLDLILLTSWLDHHDKTMGLCPEVCTLIRNLLVQVADWSGGPRSGSAPVRGDSTDQ